MFPAQAGNICLIFLEGRNVSIISDKVWSFFGPFRWRSSVLFRGSKAVWNFSKNSSIFVGTGFPKDGDGSRYCFRIDLTFGSFSPKESLKSPKFLFGGQFLKLRSDGDLGISAEEKLVLPIVEEVDPLTLLTQVLPGQ